eukprot:CAMPEP_0117437584 /NCGR_PEP_ID=MMETSP0759-20121206/1599_1 /TAXON_ID=63605 /ORGANISM="Percolomonas cosmopolitus, Strain WS" /LENGTH=372 /DNA_ID=CAMNT_0005229221 /DNA_START=1059 /DNA_END=2177 /DNA_ORIENTATION=+
MFPENFDFDRMIPFASKAQVEENQENAEFLLVDIRSAPELEKEPLIRKDAYHIAWPMKSSQPAKDFVKSFDVMRTEGKKYVVVMCASGRRAYLAAKALRESLPELKTKIGVFQGGAGEWYGKGLLTRQNKLFFRHSYDKDGSSWTNTYLLADTETKEAVLIDSVYEQYERDMKQIKELGFKLKYLVETHVHADHVTASARIRANENRAKDAKHVVGSDAGVKDHKDVIKVQPGDLIEFGAHYLVAISTPGHTNGCMSYFLSDMSRVFTGDCLLVRGTGRTDFQAGDADAMYDSIQNRLYTLPDNVQVLPAHNYDGLTASSIKEEKQWNRRIAQGVERGKFVDTMNNLKLAEPRIMHIAVGLNLNLGNTDVIP